MTEPPAPLIARCAAMGVLCRRRRWRGADRRLSDLASTLGQADALGAILDQAQHLEAQALHGGEGRGRRRRHGDGAQDFVFLEMNTSLTNVPSVLKT